MLRDASGHIHTSLDPSRVAAQIVAGIGFIRQAASSSSAATPAPADHGQLATELHELDGVLDVYAGDANGSSY